MFLYKITKKGGYVSVKAKKVLKIILIILLVAVLIVGGYIIYVMIDYHRIEDNQALQINDVTSESALLTKSIRPFRTISVLRLILPTSASLWTAVQRAVLIPRSRLRA